MADKNRFRFWKKKQSEADYQEGAKLYEAKANEYYADNEKTEKLVRDAKAKSEKNKSALGDAWEKIQLLFELVGSWRKGEYRAIPKKSIIMIIATIIYFVSPVDLLPDFIVGLGLFDDAAVISFTFKQIANDLEKYRAWRDSSREEDNLPKD
ncbi:YkvA family protein [Ornithinibacillus xuwenensis]|uniref:YkvA family protein n=1 Tax=Ornithinibacillus xuwenensis TaxID=3144668 RepID=A0ABU9XGH1_9BACI